MTQHEAKTILHACRTSGADAADPLVAEALALAARDPELQQWFAEWQALDRAVAFKLKAAPVLPTSLLQQVREGAAARASVRRRSPAHLPLALAACLLLLGTLAAWWVSVSRDARPVGPLVLLRTDMAGFLQEFPVLALETDRLADVRTWLAAHGPWADVSVPGGLQSFPTLGCRTVAWREQPVALICFMVEGEVVHLFVLPAAEFPEALASPQFARVGRFSTATWVAGTNVLLAMTPGNEELLRKVL